MSQSVSIYGAISARVGFGAFCEKIGNSFFGCVVAEQRAQRPVAVLSRGQSLVDGLGSRGEEENDPARSHDLTIFFADGHSPTSRNDTAGFFGQFAEDVCLDPPEFILAILFEYLRDRFLGSILDQIVHIHERESKQFRGSDSAEGFASAGETDEINIARGVHSYAAVPTPNSWWDAM